MLYDSKPVLHPCLRCSLLVICVLRVPHWIFPPEDSLLTWILTCLPKVCTVQSLQHSQTLHYLGVNISEDLTWTAHIQTQVKKARQRLYHLRQLRKFRVSPAILKTFYSGAIESVLTQCISVWYSDATNQDCKALQRVVRLAERISGSALPSLQDIYLKRCKSRAAK